MHQAGAPSEQNKDPLNDMTNRQLLTLLLGLLINSSLYGQDAPSQRLTPAELYSRVSPAIARVYRLDQQGRPTGQGTGFFISEDGRLVTNHHVIDPAMTVTSTAWSLERRRSSPGSSGAWSGSA